MQESPPRRGSTLQRIFFFKVLEQHKQNNLQMCMKVWVFSEIRCGFFFKKNNLQMCMKVWVFSEIQCVCVCVLRNSMCVCVFSEIQGVCVCSQKFNVCVRVRGTHTYLHCNIYICRYVYSCYVDTYTVHIRIYIAM